MNSLIRFAPGSARSLPNEFDRLFDGFWTLRNDESGDAMWTPRVDLSETAEAYMVEIDVPGMKRDDININFHDHTLSISGDRRTESTDEQKGEYVRIERSHGSFYRSFTLPKSVDSNKIEARYEDGVLTVMIPKAEDSKPKRIDVR